MTAAPHNENTEASVIGAVLTWPDRLLGPVLATGLEAEDFYVPRFRRAWEAIVATIDAGQPIDEHTVDARLGERRTLADAIYAAGTSLPDHAPAWATTIRNHRRARQMVPIVETMVTAVRAGDVDAVIELVHDLLDAAEVAPA